MTPPESRACWISPDAIGVAILAKLLLDCYGTLEGNWTVGDLQAVLRVN